MEYESGLEITALPISKFGHEVVSGDCTDDISNDLEPPEEDWGDLLNGHHLPLENPTPPIKNNVRNPYYFPELSRPPTQPPKKKSFQNPAAIELDESSLWYEDSWTDHQTPVVRFRCLKCGDGGYETLPLLRDHQKQCFRFQKALPGNNRSRRKVYACNSCGTYHSGFDLYVHIFQVHQRHVCLFCMSVFMRADKLSYHLRTRHRTPNTAYSSLADFFSHYSKGCMLSCCSCSRLFNETDNFYGHECRRPKNKAAKGGGDNFGMLPADNHKHPSAASHQSANFTLPQLRDVTIIPISKKAAKKEAQESNQRAPCLRIKLSVPKKSKKKARAPPEPPPPEPEPVSYVKEPEETPAVVSPVRLNGESSMFDSDVSRNDGSDWTQEPPFTQPLLSEAEPEPEPEQVEEPPPPPAEEEIQLAGEDAPLIDLYIGKPPEELQIRELLKQAITEACSTCVFCSHAVKIAVNGKQLALHLLSQHRFQLNLDKEQLPLEVFIELVKSRLPELEIAYFNCDSYDNALNPEEPPKFMKHYECFQCRYVTILHKELYIHNRKMHQKHSLVCTMCKTNFFNYSELLCHLCPGMYIDNYSTKFRCCFCAVDTLPSSFRLMVHLRKCHLSCEVCLEATADQSKLSVHVWKHKLNHYCHKCCIAYRNKTDMTRHLFWKHGTESVTCKKCMQKKWPYVYHFCVPPSQFSCEECGSTFGRAVALKVHKRLHANELLYPCGECNESFISRKLLARHDTTVHNPPPPPPPEEKKDEPDVDVDVMATDGENSMPPTEVSTDQPAEFAEDKVDTPEKKTTPKRDVLDLPPLNLSSESESESDAEDSAAKPQVTNPVEKEADTAVIEKLEDSAGPSTIPSDSVWDNFKDQKEESKEKDEKAEKEEEIVPMEVVAELPPPAEEPPPVPTLPLEELAEMVNFDHDYFNIPAHAPGEEPVDEPAMPVIEDFQIPGDMILASFTEGIQLSPPRFFKKKRTADSSGSSSDSSSSSSDSDSSSCSCSSSNCSCGSGSSSNSSSSSSSDSESETERKARKLKRKLKKRAKTEQSMTNGLANDHSEVKDEDQEPIDLGPPVLYFHESDLDTNESASDDEDFYDEHPRKLGATRPPTLSSIFSPTITPAPTPPPSLENGVAGGNTTSFGSTLPQHTELKPKAKKKKRQSQHHASPSEPPKKKRKDHWSPDAIYESNLRYFLQNQVKKSTTPVSETLGTEVVDGSRASKRKRVPKKFYGDSDEEDESSQHMFSPMMTISTPIIRPAKKKSRSSSVMSESAPSTPVRPLSPREESESSRRLQDVINYVAAGYDGRTAENQPYRGRPKLVLTIPTGSFSRYSEEFHKSESSSEEEEEEAYDSDDEAEPEPPVIVQSPMQEAIETFSRAHPSELHRLDSKVYCYCRCPYDEVSEMIGCDSPNCPIEWFHFDCVGISVPPIGTWYCPECRKKQALPAA